MFNEQAWFAFYWIDLVRRAAHRHAGFTQLLDYLLTDCRLVLFLPENILEHA